MDWSTVFTILATGVVTAGGTWGKSILDARLETKRLDAKRKDDADERARQEEKERKLQLSQHETQAKRNALTAMSAFTKLLSDLSALPSTASSDAIAHRWNTRYDATAREAVELIHDAETRENMITAITALNNLDTYIRVNHLKSNPHWLARELVQLLIALAGADSRGDDLQITVQQQVAYAKDQVNMMKDYFED